jgi:hypothetical protein
MVASDGARLEMHVIIPGWRFSTHVVSDSELLKQLIESCSLTFVGYVAAERLDKNGEVLSDTL